MAQEISKNGGAAGCNQESMLVGNKWDPCCAKLSTKLRHEMNHSAKITAIARHVRSSGRDTIPVSLLKMLAQLRDLQILSPYNGICPGDKIMNDLINLTHANIPRSYTPDFTSIAKDRNTSSSIPSSNAVPYAKPAPARQHA
jgi:hypothetical protein